MPSEMIAAEEDVAAAGRVGALDDQRLHDAERDRHHGGADGVDDGVAAGSTAK